MSEMIDRVGIAIDDVLTEAWNGNATDIHKRIARAAIEAMREPTPDMIEASFLALPSPNHVWSVMIDAALK